MTDCVFCDPEKIKPRTIASFDGVNIVATLGQITEGGYVLLIPTDHVPCLGAMNKKQISIVDNISRQIDHVLRKEYNSGVTIFEHGIVGQTIKHAHLHLFPEFVYLTDKIRSDFPKSEIQFVKNLVDLQFQYQKRQEPYLFWSTTLGKFRVIWNPPAPAQYLRIVSADLLGVPERADWKKMDPELDKTLIDETMKRLSPYLTK